MYQGHNVEKGFGKSVREREKEKENEGARRETSGKKAWVDQSCVLNKQRPLQKV